MRTQTLLGRSQLARFQKLPQRKWKQQRWKPLRFAMPQPSLQRGLQLPMRSQRSMPRTTLQSCSKPPDHRIPPKPGMQPGRQQR